MSAADVVFTGGVHPWGAAEITIGGEPLEVSAGQMVLMPAHRPHAVGARTRFKMLLTMIRSA